MPRRNVEELDDWAREHDLLHAREREERKLEDVRLIDAVKKHVEVAVRPLSEVPAKLDALMKTNDEQLDIMRDSAEERGRRIQREADAAAKKAEEATALEKTKAEAAIALEKAKLDADAQARLDANKIEELKQRNARLQIIAGVVSGIIIALITTYFAVHK